MVTEETYFKSYFKCFIHAKSQFREKNPALRIEKFPSLVLSRNAIMLQHLIIQFRLHYLSSACSREVENIRKLQTFRSKTGRGRVREVLAYERGSKYSDSTWKRLVFWKTGC